MARKKFKKFKAFRPPQEILDQFPYVKDFLDALDNLSDEKSHRGSVVLACAYLDDLLKGMLEAFFIDRNEARQLTDGYDAPLGTFSSRIRAVYALALIDDFEFKDLNTIRGIRNDFAHKRTASFETQSIKDRCAKLECKAVESPSRPNEPFARFSTAVSSLMTRFAGRDVEISKVRMHPRKWQSDPMTFKKLVELGMAEEEPVKSPARKRIRRAKRSSGG